MATAERIVLVGGGLASATAAQELRDQGYRGELHLVTAERHEPYLRPPLSKEFLLGKDGLTSVFVHPRAWYSSNAVTLVTGTEATRIGDHEVELADGRTLPFDGLLLATGGEPRRLGIPGEDAEGVRHLRTLDDSEELKTLLADGGRRVALIGSGWIGLEVAAAAREYGNDVTVVARGRVPLASAIGDELGRHFQRLHERNGVRFVLGADPRGVVVEGGRAAGVETAEGRVDADVVLIAAGIEPRVALAETAGIEVDDGILVDEHLRTSRADVVAAGDVARAWHPVIRERMRNEHWATAVASGKVAAATLAGRDAVLDDIPYLYSDQYDLGMEYSGYPPLQDGAELLYRGDRDAGEFVAFWLRDDRVVAGMNINVWDVNEEVQRLIRDEVRIDRGRLADSSVELSDLR